MSLSPIHGVPLLVYPAVGSVLLLLLSLWALRWYRLHLLDYVASPVYAIKQLARRTRDFGVAYSELQFGRLLGKGSQGEVFAAQWRGLTVAVKKIDTRTVPDEIVDEFAQEADIMRRLRHPCLTLFMGVSLEHPHLCIVTECVRRGSLFDILQEEAAGFTWRRALQIMTDIASSMTYLHAHSPPILHRDLKSLNVLVDGNWRGKVADLGMARFQESSEGHTMTQCLCVRTRVHLSSGKAVPAGSVRPGARLLGRDGHVVTVQAAALGRTGTMYRVEHERAPGYTVTPNHLVTLRWGEGPRCVLARDASQQWPRGARAYVCWWEMDQGRPVERRMPERHCALIGLPELDDSAVTLKGAQANPSDDNSDDALRCRAWEEFHVSAAAGGAGARALLRGDLVDIRADVLAERAVWDIVTGGDVSSGGGGAKQHRATGRRTTLRVAREEEWTDGHGRDAAVSPIVPPVPAHARASPSFPFSRSDVHRIAENGTAPPRGDMLPLAHSALEDGSWRAARPGDHARIVVDLASHRTASGAGEKQHPHLSRSLRNVDRVLAHLGERRAGIVVASALPGNAGPHDSEESSWAAHMVLLLGSFGTDVVVACGPDAHARWMGADRLLSGVSQLRTGSTPHGRRYTSFTYAPPSSPASPPRRIAVWHSLDLREVGRLQHVVESFQSALGLPACPARPAIDAWHSAGLRLRSVQAIHRPGQRFAALTVDGEHRFAIEGGILTHVRPRPRPQHAPSL